MQIEYLPIDQIIPYDNNPRHNDKAIEEVAKSIKDYGFNVPIILDNTGIIVAGHTRLKAAKMLGIATVPVYRINLTDDKIRAYRIADNKSAEYAEWDITALKEELQLLHQNGFDLSLTCFSEEEIKKFLAPDEVTNEGLTDEDLVAATSAGTISRSGDIWVLGNHRLLCGDAADILNIERLVNGNAVDMIFTDPPYNIGFSARYKKLEDGTTEKKFDVIENDDLSDEEFKEFISAICATITTLNPACYYIWCNWRFYGLLQELLPFSACIVWAKNNFGLGSGYRHQHEFCLFNGKIDQNIANESDLWRVDKDTSYLHPTQKPVALATRAFGNHKDAHTILDLFGGSGSTLIASEKHGKRCFVAEIDPIYCDVIINRWQQFTGKKAILENQ